MVELWESNFLSATDDKLVATIKDFVRQPARDTAELTVTSDPFWQALRDMGTELWLDTGDIGAAMELWTEEFTALTTNNTLLNNEVQKGIYDDLVKEASALLGDLDDRAKVIEIAFILNARHGLRLANTFKGKVSVELHTDLAHDVERSVHYGLRYVDICPDHFIVKVPLTPSGLIATRRLREQGVPVNFTLGFGARQNAIATMFARPSYVNVFLGRLNAYAMNNKLGDGNWLGEKATLAAQRCVTGLRRDAGTPTRLIAASLRGPQNCADLVGVDVYTMPTKVAAAAKTELSGKWSSRLDEDYQVNWAVDAEAIRAAAIHEVTETEMQFAKDLDARPPATAEELVALAHDAGLADIFPKLSRADMDVIASDGKIPVHARWAERIADGELAIDTLLNLAGLASFSQDQAALDDRIRGLIR